MQCKSGRWKIQISSAGSGFAGQIYTGELPEVDSARTLRQDEQKFCIDICKLLIRISFVFPIDYI